MRRRHLEVVPARIQTAAELRAHHFYTDALQHLSESRIPFLVGGAYAYARYVAIERATKDLDIFVRADDIDEVLRSFRSIGYAVDLTFPHWLGKVYSGTAFMDVIFSSGNGIARVDDVWFEHATESEVLGVRVQLCPPEEMIWSKAFVQERERFDGADVVHLLNCLGPSLDWPRLLARFGPHWRVLLGHIISFGFVYPDRRDRVPRWVTEELLARFASEEAEPDSRVCNGPLLSREQYLPDLVRDSYEDPRLEPFGSLTTEALQIWNADIAKK